jgi:hypothetical protein
MKRRFNEHGKLIRFVTDSKYVDVNTGEEINRNEAINKKKWLLLNSIKKTKWNDKGDVCFISILNEVKKNPQLTLFNV